MKKKIKWGDNSSLAEIYQGGLQMALASPPDENDVIRQATTFVTCKDFFQDAVQATHLKEERSIWQFRYNPNTMPPLSFDRFRVLIGNNTDKQFADKIENVLDFIHQFEKRIHLIRTNAYECDSPPKKWEKTGGVYLFEGSGRWMIAPPMISLYTLLLRCGFVHKKGDEFDKTCKGIIDGTIATIGDKGKRSSGCYDDTYLRDGQPAIKAILKHGYRRIFGPDAEKNFPRSIVVGTMHDKCGIVGFSEHLNGSAMQIQDKVPHWFKPMAAKAKAPAKKKVKKV